MNLKESERDLLWKCGNFSYLSSCNEKGFNIKKTISKSSSEFELYKNEIQQEYAINKDIFQDIDVLYVENEKEVSIHYMSSTHTLLCFYFYNKELNEIEHIFHKLCLKLFSLHKTNNAVYSISPYSIAVDPNTLEIEFIQQQWEKSTFLTIHPQYLSPEQTKLVEREIDNRSDFYSLGVCLYRFLMGKIPLETQDRETLLREIVTKKLFIAEHTRVSGYLLLITNKLLSKLSTNRYQSAYSIYYDLHQKENLKKTKLAHLDFINKGETQITEILNSKAKKELNKLIDMCKNGYIGIVKFQADPLHHPYNFIFKYLCELNSRNIYSVIRISTDAHKSIPFLSISLLLRELAHFMYYSEMFDKKTTKDFFSSLHPMLQKSLILLCDDFKKCIEKDISLTNFKLSDSNTVYIAVKQLLTFLLGNSSPIVIYIEKIENLDFDSFKLLLEIYKDESLGKLLFIYTTEKQFDFTHFTISKKTIQKTIRLESITETELNTFISNQFDECFDKRELFSKFVHDKSGGSPAVCYDIINKILENKDLTYQITQKKWLWNKDFFNFSPIDFDQWLENRIDQFPDQLKHTLALGSVSGEFFDISTIAKTLKTSTQQITKNCWIAEKHGFIARYNHYNANDNAQNQIVYRFTSFKILKYIRKKYTFLYNPYLNQLKTNILDHASSNENFLLFHEFFQKYSNDYIHMNQENTLKLSEYFQSLSFRFFVLNKIKEAQSAITLARNFLPAKPWEKEYEYCENLFFLALKIAVENNDHTSLKTIRDEIVLHVKKTSRIIEMNLYLIDFYLNRDFKTKVNQLIKESFKSINSPLPEKMLFFVKTTIIIKELLFNNKILNKELTFSDKKLTEKDYFTIELIKKFFKKRDQTFIYSFQKLFIPIIKNGINEKHAIVLLYYTLYLFEKGKNIKVAKQLTKTIMNKKLDDLDLENEKLLFYETKLLAYNENVKNSKSKLQEEIVSNIDIGNYSDAYYYTFNYFFLLILNGDNLATTIKKVNEYIKRPAQKIKDNMFYDLIKVFLNNFEGLTKADLPFFEEIEVTKPQKEIIFWNFLTKSFIYYLTDNHIGLGNYIKNAQHNTSSSMKGLPTIILHYFNLLSMLQTHTNAAEEQKIDVLRKAIVFAELFSPVAKEAPFNFGHTHTYMLAAIEMCKKHYKQATVYLHKAITYAQENNNILFLALCYKSLAQCYGHMNKPEDYETAIVKSYNYFNLWGAHAIANKIKRKNKFLFDEMEQRITISI